MLPKRLDTAASAESHPPRATIARDERAHVDEYVRVPQVGERLAARIHETLHIESLEDLEAAAHDGRLATVPGVGEGRARAVREYLDLFLATPHPRSAPDAARPPVSVLLEVDADYRRLAADGHLPRVAPRRFNPSRRAWLPVWHTMQDGWGFTVMFSNTGRAHDLGKTRDWVVVVYSRDGAEGEATVVTEYRGKLYNRRVVRGREEECEELYDERGVPDDVRRWAHRIAQDLDG